MNKQLAHIQTLAVTEAGTVLPRTAKGSVNVQNFIKIHSVDSPYMPGQVPDKVRTKSDTTTFPRSGSGLETACARE